MVHSQSQAQLCFGSQARGWFTIRDPTGLSWCQDHGPQSRGIHALLLDLLRPQTAPGTKEAKGRRNGRRTDSKATHKHLTIMEYKLFTASAKGLQGKTGHLTQRAGWGSFLVMTFHLQLSGGRAPGNRICHGGHTWMWLLRKTGLPGFCPWVYPRSLDTQFFCLSKVKVQVPQLCPTLCDSTDYTAHGILQARTLEWVAFSFTRGSSQPRDWTQVSSIAARFFTSWATREAQEYWSG